MDAGSDGVAAHLWTGAAGVRGVLRMGMEDAAVVMEPGSLRDRAADLLESYGRPVRGLEVHPGHPLARGEAGLEVLVLREGGEDQQETQKDPGGLDTSVEGGCLEDAR